MHPEATKRLRLLVSVVSVLVALAILAGTWFYSRLRASLPQLDGNNVAAGLAAAVTIERDALGVPTIRGQSRLDVARALGWLHAQDRYFQMDILRRSSAGELAEVFGKRALPRDRANRMHGFRKLAQKAVAQLPENQRALLEAYTAGVNAGLVALREKPFEYLVLRETPRPWSAEDSLLVGYAMTLDMQDETGSYEKSLMTVRDQFGADALAFFSPLVSPDDATLDGSHAPLAPTPGPKVLNLRTQKVGGRAMASKVEPDVLVGLSEIRSKTSPTGTSGSTRDIFDSARDSDLVPGSNAFALSGAHTANGAALVADDMHLDHGVPNTWYRASLEIPNRKLTGVTLPGIPLVVAGSNGHVAWGFTNACIDTGDLVVVELAPGLTSWYATPGDKTLEIEQRRETIAVKGERAVEVEYPWTIWGPIVGKNELGRPLARRWVAHDVAAINLGLIGMEDADDVASAVQVAHHAGMPAQNMVVADTTGAIAWTIAGRIPKRIGYDGRTPVSWAYGDRRWEGLLPPDDVPTIIERGPGSSKKEVALPDLSAAASANVGRLWSANQRHVGGDALAKLGDDGYRPPARAMQIRDDLAPLEHATPRDLLKVQLDDRAIFLTPWHKLLMDTLTPAALQQKKPRAALRSFAEKWEGRASIEAVSYPIVRQFRHAVYERIFNPLFASCAEANPEFSWHDLYLEPAVWQLLREKPPHLLDARFTTWDDLLVAAADDVIAFLDKQAITLPEATWGLRNTLQIRHPFSYSLPEWATNWLNMPRERLPGDTDMPRVQAPRHGASERFVVSPGHEAEGIFHMPCGQSGHPLSPFYRAGHEAWAHGEPTSFLPGKTEHTLTLKP